MSLSVSAHVALVVLALMLLALTWFIFAFSRGEFYGRFGEVERTTTLSDFYLDESELPDGWFIEHNRQNTISLAQNQANGCLVEAKKYTGTQKQAVAASKAIEKQIEHSINELTTNGYDIDRLPPGEVVLDGPNGQHKWTTFEIEGVWLDNTVYFRQSNSVMAGDGYWLRLGRSCLHGDLNPALEASKAIRFL